MVRVLATSALVVLLSARMTSAVGNNGFYLQGQVGYSRTLYPHFMSVYWASSTQFSGGFGVLLVKSALLCTYSNHVFNNKGGTISEGSNATGHEIHVVYKRLINHAEQKISFFYQISGGFTLLKTPFLYKESDLFPEFIDRDQLLEPAHNMGGLSVSFGSGLNYRLSDTSFLFLELFCTTASLKPDAYSQLGMRSGVLFQIGN